MEELQTSISESPLLAYAVSKLRPDIFSHPVWIRFSKIDRTASPGIIENLFSVVRKLQRDHPSDACQVLLICAVYQNHLGRRQRALQTTQLTMTLATQSGLSQEILWALWGACAINFQQGNYEQASSKLVDLQAELSAQSDWVLADYVDVLKQSLFQLTTMDGDKQFLSSRDRPLGELLSVSFDWLQNWGFSACTTESRFGKDSIRDTATRSTHIQSLFSIERWQGRWRTFLLAVKGELKLQWGVTKTAHTNMSSPDLNRPEVRIDIDVDEARPQISSLPRLPLETGGPIVEPLTNRETPDISVLQVDVDEQVDQISNLPQLPLETGRPIVETLTNKETPDISISQAARDQPTDQASTVMPIAVHMLGEFSMRIGDLSIKLRASRALSLLKYLLLHHKQNTPREVLMDVFWPEAEPETARNNLNVAIHSLRRALRSTIFLPVIVFEDGAYGLDSNLQVWLDVEEFERRVHAGKRLETRNQLTAAAAEYEAAISLYQGDFLEQNPYEEWTVLDRERLRVAYLDTLGRLSQIYFNRKQYAACIAICQLILARDRCREDAHSMLMRCYSRQGQDHLALRQYQACVEALRLELDVTPTPETTKLYELIRQHRHV